MSRCRFEASSNERMVCPTPRGRCLPVCPHKQSLLQTRRWRLPARKALASSGVIPIESVMGLPLIHQYFSSSCLPYVVASNAANSLLFCHALKYFRSPSLLRFFFNTNIFSVVTNSRNGTEHDTIPLNGTSR